ncbi:thioester reductase domain-containing protein [Paraphaeosphaeria minitans]|uniref:Thioester reductase domain-containing protein n=1 Tax=Paraphaeosphaeria minitans TaxID=565426 RepID=A0A9P6G4G2_9PLEO|nr:thioester reductase domain-containing protein [Paraphaeosphaeria minitans]
MSLNRSPEPSSHGGFPSGRVEVTDFEGMQDLFARYADCLPPSKKEATPACGRKTIAIIGSTGFLGPYIVASLLKLHTESRVFCLNRSADGGQRTVSALEHATSSDISTGLPRLRFLVADVTKPDFGLDTEQAARLASEVDELVFNTWDTNWSKSLAHFEPFLRAVRNAIDFCTSASKRPRITFVSSICSVGDWPLVHPARPRVPEEAAWDNRSAMPHGYGESKCVAEQLLAKAQEASGLHVNIVRAGQIGGPSRSGLRMWPRQGWVYSILKASKRLGYFPMHIQALDWIPVDAFAEGIANSTNRLPKSKMVEVFNMFHPEPAPWNALYETLQRRFRLSLKTTSLSDWLDRVDGGKLKLHGFLRALGNGREYNMSFRNERAMEALPRVVPISEDLLAEWLQGWELGLHDLKAKI